MERGRKSVGYRRVLGVDDTLVGHANGLATVKTLITGKCMLLVKQPGF